MKVNRPAIIVSEDGTEIRDPKDGFIVMGNIFAAQVDLNDQPYGGIIGDNFDGETGQVKRLNAFTKEEMIRGLGYTVEELEMILTKMRQENMGNSF